MAYLVDDFKKNKQWIVISHCGTSSKNPTNWGEVRDGLISYLKRSPYESRISTPSITFYKNNNAYKTNFVLRRKLPTLAAYKVTRYLGTK